MYYVLLVSKSWNGKRSLKMKGTYPSQQEAREARIVLWSRLPEHVDADYRVLGPIQLKRLQEEIKAEQEARRAKGVKKAVETRKKRGKAAFVLCPKCGAKSKKLKSEMGGLQTRRCQKGHVFEFDKWLDDRAFWRFVK